MGTYAMYIQTYSWIFLKPERRYNINSCVLLVVKLWIYYAFSL